MTQNCSYPITDNALKWIENIFIERYGLDLKLYRNKQGICLELDGADEKIIFDKVESCFTEARSDIPYTLWNSESEGWKSILNLPLPTPGVSELTTPLIEINGKDYFIHYDIVGLTYWMLARIEEIDRLDLDEHDRFPAKSSHAYKKGYLHRPIVDEWLHILGQVIQRIWPKVKLKIHEPRTVVSCDVDSPYLLTGSLERMVRLAGSGLINRKSISFARNAIIGTYFARRGESRFDSHRMGIDLIMDINERFGRSVAFYFISENTDDKYDYKPNLDNPRVRSLLREIHSRGHEIGIHPGYNTFCNPENFAKSVTKMRSVLEQEGIKQNVFGGRQHFLRWKTPITAQLYEANKLDYDTSLGYADCPGFRCGTCHSFIMFDPISNCEINLIQYPLVLMESSVIDERYLGLGYSEDSIELMTKYRDYCYKVGGNFTVLWHNSHLLNNKDYQFYQKIIN